MSWSEPSDEKYDRLESLGEALIASNGWRGLFMDWDFTPGEDD